MSEWDEVADGWDDDEAVRSYAAAAFSSLDALAAKTGFRLAGARVCDFGCGTGLLTQRLADGATSVDAVDSSPAMLAVLAAKIEHHEWRHVRALLALPDDGARYDLVVCSSVLGFVEDYAATVEELVSRLAPGGLFVQWDWERGESDAEPMGLTTDQIRTALGAAGLDDITVTVAFEIGMGDATMAPLMGAGRRPSTPA